MIVVPMPPNLDGFMARYGLDEVSQVHAMTEMPPSLGRVQQSGVRVGPDLDARRVVAGQMRVIA